MRSSVLAHRYSLVPDALPARLLAVFIATFAGLAQGQELQPRSAVRNPQVWAILIGIDRYEDPAVPGCKSATADARAVARWLTTTGGWSPRNVLVMDDGSQRRHGAAAQAITDLYPTQANLSWAADQWLGARLRPNDIVLLYFAGQADEALAGANDSSANRVGILLPIDAKANDVARTGWRIESAIEGLASRGENPIVVLLDTSLTGRGEVAKVQPGSTPNSRQWLNTIARWPSISVWLGADGRPAREGASPRDRSVFAGALIEGLGTAAQPRNLVAVLDRLNRNKALAEQGFRASGSLSPDISLHAKQLAPFATAAPTLLLQRGHANRVLDVAVTPDASQILSASADSTVKIWRAADRTLLRALTYHMVGVSQMALSRDGKLLATGDGSGRLWVWRLPEYRALAYRGARPHSGEIAALEFLPDSQHFASLDAEGHVLLWSINGEQLTSRSLASEANTLACSEGRVAVATLDAGGASRVQIYGLDGAKVRTIPGPGGAVVSRGLALDGSLLAVADKDGHVLVWNLESDKEVVRNDLGKPVGLVRVALPDLIIAAGNEVRWFHVDGDDRGVALTLQGTVDQVAISSDSRWLAATSDRGEIHVWDFADRENPREITLPPDKSVLATSVAFSPRGEQLVVGCQGGQIRSWDLPGGNPLPTIPAHRGQIAALSVSDDGRTLLQITNDRKAMLWDLQEGRALRSIAGSWTDGVMRPGSMHIVMSDASGEVRLIDRVTRNRVDVNFARPQAENGEGATRWAFGRVAVSQDGKKVAAAVQDSALICIWDAATGTLLRTIRDHEGGITALQFSSDGISLLTASVDGTAKLWDTFVDAGPPSRAINAADNTPVTAAAIDAGRANRIALGLADGRVYLGDLRLGQLEGAVHALVFTADGRWLAASGDDKIVRLWSLEGTRPRLMPLDPPHAERVNALLAWPGGKLIASGSEDTTIRFWRLADQALLGTVSAVQDTGEWVAFTPDGQFDSSPGAERQVTWLREGRVMPLEQFQARFRVFRLADRLRQGELPPIRFVYQPKQPPPSLAIGAAPPTSAKREIDLDIALGESNLSNLRLYQNSIPVRDASDFVTRDAKRLTVKTQLRRGLNTFYVMAGRGADDAIEGRSNSVEIRYDGPEVPGRLHILALGVNAYPNRPLKFSAEDAKAVAERLHNQAIDGQLDLSLVRVLDNAAVTEESVRRELAAIRRVAKPEDTVVLFLAGHTDVRTDRSGRERFCLLLPNFPFPKVDSSANLLAARGTDSTRNKQDDDPRTILPYATIYQYLVRMPALQRLVIVDACRAEAVRDDPLARKFQERVAEKIDDAAHIARTSYILAARRNEPAYEVEELKHGLLTHVLLRGMASPNLQPDPAPLPPNAETDRDGVVTTEELRRYADDGLRILASRLLPTIPRSGADDASGTPSEASRGLQMQATDDQPFPLIRLPETKK
jgi:WD40 repeat protein